MPLPRTQTVEVDKTHPFEVPVGWELIRRVGSGAYGTVASFTRPVRPSSTSSSSSVELSTSSCASTAMTATSSHDNSEREKVAVKKVQSAFTDLVDAKRILREIRLLRELKHENVIRILDIFPPSSLAFEDIYIVTDLMETDLHRVIYSKQDLKEEHHQYFLYQILRGLKYLHSANVLHRDLKPSNILVNRNCDLKICDLGLARGGAPIEPDFNRYDRKQSGAGGGGKNAQGQQQQDDQYNGGSSSLTDYVVTRWYRAPEVVLDASHYHGAVDVWSVGCIFAELIGRKALCTGKDHLDQIRKIVELLGTPEESDISWLPQGGPARRFLGRCPISRGHSFESLLPQASPAAIDLLSKMLRFNPLRRITVDEALQHPFFSDLYQPSDIIIAAKPIDWSFDNFTPTKEMLQRKVYSEAALFHPELLQRDVNILKEKKWEQEVYARCHEEKQHIQSQKLQQSAAKAAAQQAAAQQAATTAAAELKTPFVNAPVIAKKRHESAVRQN